jgi:hypothetical protein
MISSGRYPRRLMNRTLSTALVRFTRTFDKQYAAILKKALCHKKGLYVYTGGATPTSACGPADEHDDNFIDMEKLMNYTNK